MTAAHDRLMTTCTVQPDGCWIWTGHIDARSGYGRLTFQGRTIGAHRLAYETWNGPILEGMHIDHLCLVRNCIAPTHLEAVTQAENNRRAWALRPKAPKPVRVPKTPKAAKPAATPKPSETGLRKCGHPYVKGADCAPCARSRSAQYREQTRMGTVQPKTITCVECGRSETNCAKGMCRRCYTRLYKRSLSHRA